MSSVPVTGNPVIDTMTKVFDWLGQQVDQILPHPPAPPAPAAAGMTDKQLHHAIHDVGASLLNGLAPTIQQSFARYGTAMADPRFRHAMPTTVRGHVLAMVTEANDAFGLSLLGLREHATAAALGPIRNVAETLAWIRWLLESLDDDVRQARAYRLTLNAIDGYRRMRETLVRVGGQSAQAAELAPHLVAAEDRMRRSLAAIIDQDGITIPASPVSASRLIEQYLPEHGGYMLYAMLNSAGAHPGAARGYLFYGRPGTGIADYDFKGLYHVRAYWIARSIRLHLDMCHATAPVLGWDQWHAFAERIQDRLRPLADEAEKRFVEPLQQALDQLPDSAPTTSVPVQPPGTSGTP